MKNLCTWSTMWLFTYSWRGSIKLYFLRMHFCLEFYIELCYIAVTIMNSLYDHNEFFIWPYWILYIPIYQSFLLGWLPSQTTFLKRTYLKFQFIRRHTDTSRHVEDNASNVPDKSGTVWSTGFWEENWNKNGWGRNYWQIQNDDNNKLSLNSRWPITNATGDHI